LYCLHFGISQLMGPEACFGIKLKSQIEKIFRRLLASPCLGTKGTDLLKISDTSFGCLVNRACVYSSLRVYHQNIDSLLDFRTQFLGGFNITVQRKLSLSQVLQLYVCTFQHPSIQDRC